MQEIAAMRGIQGSAKELLTQLTELCDPAGVHRRKLRFKIPPQFLRKRRTVTLGGDRDLQSATPNHGRVVKVAPLGIVDHVAENLPKTGFPVYEIVHINRGRSGNHE